MLDINSEVLKRDLDPKLPYKNTLPSTMIYAIPKFGQEARLKINIQLAATKKIIKQKLKF